MASRNEVALTSQPASSLRNAYITLGSCLVLLVLVHRATVASMLQTWSRDSWGLGYFVVPRRPAHASRGPAGQRSSVVEHHGQPVAALPLLGLLSFVWLLGNLTDTTVVQQLCLVTMVIAVTWSVLGTAAARALSFPLGLLLFAVPLGHRFIPHFQDFTAHFAVKMLALSNVPAVLEGHVISLADDRWATSRKLAAGLNHLVTSLAVGYLYAGAVYRQWGHRVAFLFASAVVLPIAANGLRVYHYSVLTCLGATGVASGMHHHLYGLVVFAIVISVLLITCGGWPEGTLRRAVDRDARSARNWSGRVGSLTLAHRILRNGWHVARWERTGGRQSVLASAWS